MRNNSNRILLNLFVIALCAYITSKVGWQWGLMSVTFYFLGKVSLVIDDWQDQENKVDRWN